MKIVIVGAGKVAYYLIREFVQEHEVTIIEQDEKSEIGRASCRERV